MVRYPNDVKSAGFDPRLKYLACFFPLMSLRYDGTVRVRMTIYIYIYFIDQIILKISFFNQEFFFQILARKAS